MTARWMLIACVVVATAAPGPARAASGPPAGNECGGYYQGHDDGSQSGFLQAGPITSPGSFVSVRCAMREWNSHTSAVLVAVESDVTPHAAVVAEEYATAPGSPWYDAVLCTSATVDGTVWYSDGTAWSTDPATPCNRLFGEPVPDLPPALDSVEAYLWCMHWGWYCPVLDYLLCDLDAVTPGVPGVVEVRPDGDIHVAGEWIWDCPPYGPQK